MSLSAVSSSFIRFVFAFLTFVLGAAAEEILPKTLDVGFPVLLAATVFFAPRKSIALPVLFALAAGGAEDALSSLPYFTSASYFLLTAAVIHLTGLPYVIAPFVFPVYQIWLCLWAPDLSGSVFTRVLMSFPIGILTLGAVAYGLEHLARKAAIDEEG